ncbi:MAG TPA: hypothetical protein VEH55_11010 [Gaiellaceae bacterium]|jgi:2-hydroxychromene-2-carboxylate isomerase|nr:hypothetical protein [Gaiellaceae bacterium]
MDAYNFDAIRFQTQERLDRRTHEAAAERLARQLRGTTATGRVKERLQASWASRLNRPVFGHPSMTVRHS